MAHVPPTQKPGNLFDWQSELKTPVEGWYF